MRLRRFLAAAVLAGAAALAAVQANFAAADGFSGQYGATCVACHTVAPVPQVPAEAVLEGLPDAWVPGATYTLTVRVEGGPPALPAPAPQGGFELSADLGRFAEPPGMEDRLRRPLPNSIGYEPAGTLMRSWTVEWRVPPVGELPGVPGFAHLWLAVVAASGNHVIATNASDGGERFDQVDALQATVPPSAEAMRAWLDLPLAAPAVDGVRKSDAGWTVDGRHRDANATHLLVQVDGGGWTQRETGPAWKLVLPASAASAALKSSGAGRSSLPVALDISGGTPTLGEPGVGSASGPHSSSPSKGSPLGAWPALTALAVTLLALHRESGRNQP